MADDDRDADRPAWLDVDDPPVRGGAPATRTPWLLATAALPWLVVAALLIRPPGPAGEAHPRPVGAPTGTPTASATTPATAEPDHTATEAVPSGAGDATITSSGGLIAVDDDEARAVAIVAARRWLTTVGPGARSGDGGGPLYAEHLVVEGVDHPGPGAAVVTVRALVLRVDGDAYEALELRRVAIPLRFDAGGAVPAGPPYLLPVQDPAPVELERTDAVEDPELLLAAGEALAAAGYEDISVQALHRTASWPLLVTADVRVAAGPVATVTVWLRPHLGGLVVAGTRPGRPTGTGPTDLPSSPAGPASADPSHDHEEVSP